MGVTGISTSDVYTASAAMQEKAPAMQEKAPASDKAAAAQETAKTAVESAKKEGGASAAANKEDKTNSNSAAVYDKTKLSENDRKAIVSQLKAEQEKRQSQLVDLVKDMISKQSNTYGAANNVWGFLAKGDFTVDAATKAQAQKDISEDGYWGVKQTSERILSFASALAGDDPKNLEKMRDAFIKGYDQAEKTWGGKLPDISKRTYDAVIDGFDKLMNPKTEEVTTSEDGTVVAKTQ